MSNNYSDYVDPGYVDSGYTISYQLPEPPKWANNPVNNILISYLYQQYLPDDNIESFFLAYNQLSQNYLNYLIDLNLPVWVSPSISGKLLDWVGENLYGYRRPVIASSIGELINGTYNSNVYNSIPYNSGEFELAAQAQLVSDDIYKRCLTWNLYKGDGVQFTTRWLKNRVYRFLLGKDGYVPFLDNTYFISITYASNTDIIITLLDGFSPNSAAILSQAIAQEILNLPFQYNFSVIF